MKEEEAKKKWCPQSMASLVEECRDGVAAYVYNRMPTPSNPVPDECLCIASDCMWWLWDTSPENAARANADHNAGWVPKGHCGAIK